MGSDIFMAGWGQEKPVRKKGKSKKQYDYVGEIVVASVNESIPTVRRILRKLVREAVTQSALYLRDSVETSDRADRIAKEMIP